MGELEDSREALESFQTLLDLLNEHLATNPDDQEYLAEKADTLQNIAREQEAIARLEASFRQDSSATTPPPPPPPLSNDVPSPPKYDMSKHPKFAKQFDETPPPPHATLHPPEDVQVTFNVKDSVLAQWSEDRQWYNATIMSKTGSSANPVYTVRFRDYDTTEQRHSHQVRPLPNASEKKRKADEIAEDSKTETAHPTTGSQSATTTINGGVISAAPSIDYTALHKKEPSKVGDGPTRLNPEPKKLKGKKALDRNQNSWLAFSKSGPKNKDGSASGTFKKKDSMFRTPDLPNAKVGFTGSGKPMSKDQQRSKWNYTDAD